MTTAHEPILSSEDKTWKRVHWRFARSHPVLVFLLITFAWSWLMWFASVPLSRQDTTLMMALTYTGAYGPAIGTILTLSLRNGLTISLSRRRVIVLAFAFIAIFTVMVLRTLAGSLPHYDPMPQNPTLTVPLIVLVILAGLIGAWVISSARSENPAVRERMESLIPSRLPLRWFGFALFFYVATLLISWGIGYLLGLEIITPPLWEHSAPEAIYFLILTFLMTALARGGMEEPGWRGFMLPELQRRSSPLMASLIIAIFWDLWHIPLHLNGFYLEGLVEGMLARSIYIYPVAIVFTWFFNRTGGNLFLLVCLHSTIDVVSAFVPYSDLPMMVLWVAFVVMIVLRDKMYRIRSDSVIGPKTRGTASVLSAAA